MTGPQQAVVLSFTEVLVFLCPDFRFGYISTMASRPPFGLFILDGLAHNPNPEGNAVYAAHKPTLEKLWSECPYTELVTFGERVGLPDDQMGNSEVGHLNIGAGRVVEQDLLRINKAIRTNTLKKLPAFQKILTARNPEYALHILGLCSTGGVHSSMEHLFGILEEALEAGCPRVFIHVITDGRDRPQTASLEEVKALHERVIQLREQYPDQQLAMVDLIGRYYAMDRDKRWERTLLAYELYTRPTGQIFPNILSAIQSRQAAGETDEFYKPCRVATPAGYRSGEIRDGDSLLCFNFRADRMRQIVTPFLQQQMGGMNLPLQVTLSAIVTLTEYDKNYPVEILFPPIKITNHLGSVVSNAGLKQLRMAETEKYPHVTYFFNGGVEQPLEGEERVLVQSPKDVPTYDFKPEMSAFELTDRIIEKLEAGAADVYIVNFANCDMVGHTGVFDAAVKAVETVDTCMGRILAVMAKVGGSGIITADHGNADQMVDYETGEPHTFHTKHPVPLVLFGPLSIGATLRADGALCDIAPTICELLNLAQPEDMKGHSLLG